VKFSFSILYESFFIAISSLRANKLRTFLTLLGIIVGVTSVITVITIIKGLDKTVSSTFSAQGSTVFSVAKRPLVITSREDFIKFNKRKEVTKEDAETIRRLCRQCWRIGMATNSGGVVKFEEKRSEGVAIRGLTLPMFEIENTTIQAGRLWTENEGNAAPHYVIIGTDLLENLFGGALPERVIGKHIYVNGSSFLITGVANSFGKVLGFSRDNFVYMPFQTSQKLFGSRDSITVHIQVQNSAFFDDAKDEVNTIMRNRRGKTFADEDNGFSVESQDTFIGIYQNATSGIFFVTVFVAAISLVVGGIVVMNIMLVSVTERTKEVGLRKAVGAKQGDILRQFLIEAVTVTAIGGLIGVVTGFGLAYLLSALLGFPLEVNISSAVLGVGVSSVVGIVSGLYPAWKASQLNPIEAMRNE
jgi:putative ABC transport system permease protein